MKVYLRPQETLLIPPAPSDKSDKKHLFVVLTAEAVFVDTKVLSMMLVPINSIYLGMPFDAACVLEEGEHKWVKHKSFVNYHFARIESVKGLVRNISKQVYLRRTPVTNDVFERIKAGFAKSKHVSEQMRVFYRIAWNNQSS